MIARYTRPAMAALWSQENQYRRWLEVELLAAEAWAELGRVPRDAARRLRERATFRVERIRELEQVNDHELIAFLSAVSETVGDDARYLHLGLTSSDVMDTALASLAAEAMGHVIAGVEELRQALASEAIRYRRTPMIGRTHGVHAEPITFGLKLARWWDQLGRDLERLLRARDAIAVGKLSGAVGTFAHVDPFVEAYVCQRLGLRPAPISSQVVSRDRHAEAAAALAILGASLEEFATEIRLMQQTEVGELEEPFPPGQRGSSAMPHKRNPMRSERIAGLARVLRGYALVAMENVALWHERDISHSSTERIWVVDATTLADYVVALLTRVVRGWRVYEARMKANLEATGGLVFSERVLLALVDAGMSREEAYRRVQAHAMAARDEAAAGVLGATSFKARVLSDPDLAAVAGRERLERAFELEPFLSKVDAIFERLEIERLTQENPARARQSQGAVQGIQDAGSGAPGR
ncbi:MAG: adenylosuccinate lyase [Limnochordaceae bacterium]|nr:adenylosuccinate lyase [Limnochordaceae bacterium]